MSIFTIGLVCLGYFLFLILFMHIENNLGYFMFKALSKLGSPVMTIEYVDHLSRDEYKACIQSTLLLFIFMSLLAFGVDNMPTV